jgi:hypothetical protein
MNKFVFYGEEHHVDLPLLLSNKEEGTIHSIFQNGFNIKMGESLVFIGNTKNGRLPFGIHLKNDTLFLLLRFITNDLRVIWKGDALYFSNESIQFKLDLIRSKAYTNPIPKMNIKNQFPSFERFLSMYIDHREPIGIDDLYMEDFLVYFLENQPIVQVDLATKVKELMDAVFSENEVFIEKVLRYFLGRGKGLTPSGDDILVGLLAIQSVTGHFSPTFIGVLRQLITSEALTTDISREYLLYALNEKFSSIIVQMLEDLLNDEPMEMDKHFQDLVGIGHSSGVDSTFGLIIGIVTIRRKN